MCRSVSLFSVCGALLLGLAGCKSTPPKPKTAVENAIWKPLNVVVITLDTVRADHLRCYGDTHIQTPNIDALAQQGTLFEHALAQTPLTQPSHASIFTGTNPNVHNVRDTGGFALQPSSVTLATVLRNHGWNTAAFVSSSVLKKVFGLSQGFSVYDDQMPETADDNGETVAVRRASLTVDRALAWLNNQPSQHPYFVWLHLYDAHRPYNPPAEFRKQYPHDLYSAEIAYDDQQVGRFLAAVRKKSPPEKTVIVLLADHGEGLGDHGEYDHGVFLYDSTVRIPWIISGPGIPAGRRIAQQAREIDVLPTILGELQGAPPAGVQGVDLLPALHGQPMPETYSYEETLYPKLSFNWAELRGIHTTRWMYVRAPKPELYDLSDDPGELHNVIDAHPKEYRELEQQLKALGRLGADGTETVKLTPMDDKTTEQLRSLGYVGGDVNQDIQLNGKGADPKDQVGILRILSAINGENGEHLTAAEKIAQLNHALVEDPNNPALYTDLARQYAAAGQYPRAIDTYLAAEKHGGTNFMTYSHLGELYLRTGNLQNAVANLQRAAQLNPLDVQGQANLGTAYINMNRLDDAEKSFRWVLTLQEFAPAWNGLGIIAMQRNKLPAARQDFEHAIQIDPQSTEAHLNLGILCTQTHDFACARKTFKVFLAHANPADYKDMIPRVQFALAHMPE